MHLRENAFLIKDSNIFLRVFLDDFAAWNNLKFNWDIFLIEHKSYKISQTFQNTIINLRENVLLTRGSNIFLRNFPDDSRLPGIFRNLTVNFYPSEGKCYKISHTCFSF